MAKQNDGVLGAMLIILIIIALTVFLPKIIQAQNIYCTMDMKQCEDGSYVGRNSKNNCQFYPCPITNVALPYWVEQQIQPITPSCTTDAECPMIEKERTTYNDCSMFWEPHTQKLNSSQVCDDGKCIQPLIRAMPPVQCSSTQLALQQYKWLIIGGAVLFMIALFMRRK